MKLLAGVKVLECAQAIQGGAAGCILADLGADVIKIEDQNGDRLRAFRSLMGVSNELPGGRNLTFEAVNRNKRSIVLNLKSEEGRAILYRLVARSDVFVTNYLERVRNRLGIDYQSISAHNPQLVYAVASAYGERGPSAEEKALDNVVFARSGMMFCIGEDGDVPYYMVPAAADELGGLMSAFAITAALFDRSQSGMGQQIETSLLGSLIHFLTVPLSVNLIGGRLPKRPARQKLFNPLVGWYRCSDGRWLMLSANRPQIEWPLLCEALELGDEVQNNPKYNSIRARAEHCEEVISLLDRVFLTKPREHWLSELRSRELLCSPINRVQDVANDPQIIANRYVVDVDHPSLGPIKMVNLPIWSRGESVSVESVAPELGQHTEEVLLDLGYSWEAIAELRDKGVV